MDTILDNVKELHQFGQVSLVLISMILLPKIGVIDFSVIPLAIVTFWHILKKPSLLKLPIPAIFRAMIYIFILCFSLALLSSIVHGKLASYDVLLKPLRLIFILIFGYLYLMGKRISKNDVLRSILWAAVINGLVILVQMILHTTGVSIDFLINPSFDINVNVSYRKPGLVNGFPIAGLLQVFGLVILYGSPSMRISAVTKHLMNIILLSSMIFTARTAILCFLIFLFIHICSKRLVITGKGIFITFFIIPILWLLLINIMNVNTETFSFMLGLFIIFFSSGTIDDPSVLGLVDSYQYFPERITTLF